VSSDWRPLHARDSVSPAEFDGPYDGVPEWLLPRLWEWCENLMPSIWRGRTYSFDPMAIRAWRDMGLALHIAVPDAYVEEGHKLQGAWYEHIRGRPDHLLSVADYVLSHVLQRSNTGDQKSVAELGGMLSDAGSVWEVSSDGALWYLSRRVGDEARAAADSIMAGSDRAAEYMRRAWRSVYGREPHPADGYRDAIRAVEAAAIPVVSPLNTKATLGTIIADLRAAPHKWTVQLNHPSHEAQVRAVADCLDLVWKGDLRHGTPDEATPVALTLQEAEAALHLSLTMVKWFRDGIVVRLE